MREAATICPDPCKLTFDLLTVKVVSESHVTWATTSVPILVFIGLPLLNFGPMYATDRQTSDAHHRLMPPNLGAGHNNKTKTKTTGSKQWHLGDLIFK